MSKVVRAYRRSSQVKVIWKPGHWQGFYIHVRKSHGKVVMVKWLATLLPPLHMGTRPLGLGITPYGVFLPGIHAILCSNHRIDRYSQIALVLLKVFCFL